MEKLLYRVDVEVEIYVMATSKLDAEEEAIRHMGEETAAAMGYARRVMKHEDCDPEVLDCLPWNGDGKTMVAQIIDTDKPESE